MKRFFLFALVATALAACSTDTTQDLAPEIPTAPDELQVSFDEEDTRIQLQNNVAVWTEGDLVSVFYRSNAHDKYEFTGETGDTSGTLKRVSQGTPTVGLDKVVAIYPYNENYLLSLLSGNIKASLPAEQTYLADSYGLGSSIMISSSKTDRLYMRNVCGWLKLQFTGADTAIKKIVLRGNNDEQVAGDIYICSDDASCTLASDLTGADGVNSGDLEGTLVGTNTIITSVTLNCGDGVALNSETPTAFYIALPPQTFEKGVTITAMCNDGTMRRKSTENSIIVNRNHIVQMASLAVETLETTDTPDTPITPTQPTPAANEIWYTTTSGEKIILDCVPSDFGAILISNKYENGQGILTFDDKVTKIPTVFRENAYLKSITIPNSVTEIVNNAFRDCSALTSVTIGNSVTEIGLGAFDSCSALTSVTIPDSVTTIGDSAFYDCDALTSVTIGNSVTEIGDRAFYDCSALKEVYCKPTTPPSLDGSSVFDYNASGRKIYVPTASVDAYKAADGWKEYADAIVAMPIPSNQIWYTSSDGNVVTPYKTYVFGANITSNTYKNGVGVITFDGDVTTIGYEAFWGCSALTSVTIPDSVMTIGSGAFEYCDALKAFYGKFASADNRCLIVNGVLNSFAPAGLTTYSIPDNVTTIGYIAFGYCSLLTSVTIPDSVTQIGGYAFFGCDALTSVTIGNGVTAIGGSAFRDCSALTSVTIPDSVTTIGDYAFYYCSALTSVTIGNNVTTIGEDAFRDCDALTSVTIPDSVTTIGSGAFVSCDALKSVTIGNGVTTIGGSAFRVCSSLTSVTIPDSVTTIGEDAFGICSKLTAFYGKFASADNRCLIVDGVLNSFAPAGLTEYTIPDSVTKIGGWAFDSCDALTSITIPNSVTTIGDAAFGGCSSLKEVYCEPTTPPSLDGSYVFNNNASDRKIYVPIASVDAYKAKQNWSYYASAIYPYTFTE